MTRRKTPKISAASMMTAALMAPYAMNFVKGLMKEDAEIGSVTIIVKRAKT